MAIGKCEHAELHLTEDQSEPVLTDSRKFICQDLLLARFTIHHGDIASMLTHMRHSKAKVCFFFLLLNECCFQTPPKEMRHE